MKLNTVIFDMDGLLIDSEPLWNEAAAEIFQQYKMNITTQQYASTTGMRVKEFVIYWFRQFNVPQQHAPKATQDIIQLVIKKVKEKGKPMPGITHIFNYFLDRNFKIGLASSSGMDLIDVVVDLLDIRKQLSSICSAADLPFGKPHPQVYLNCAAELGSHPQECICFEDSFNGLIAAKSASMKCVVVPSQHDSKNAKFNAADLKISSLQNFNDLLMQTL